MIGRNRIQSVTMALALAAAVPALADTTIYDSGGFEPPKFTPGNLAGQDSGTWVSQNSSGSGTVETSVVASGSQAVKVFRAAGDSSTDNRYWPNQTAVIPQRYVLINWDQETLQSSVANTPFGPFFGIEGYDSATKRVGAAGVDATTGEVLFEDPSQGGAFATTPTDTKVPFGSFVHFEMVVDYTVPGFSVYVNGQNVVNASGFPDGQVSTDFSDADISALAAQADSTETGTAYFDNYKVTTMRRAGAGFDGRHRPGRRFDAGASPPNDLIHPPNTDVE